jgi:hypothetical protein
MTPVPAMPGSPFLRLAAVLLLCVAGASGAQDIPSKPLQFEAGSNAALAKGRLVGDDTIDYVFTARGGENVTAVLESGSIGYFNVLPPGSSGEAIFIGSSAGNRFSGTLEAPGEYRFRVYQMRASARRGQATDYTLRVEVAPGDAAPAASGFRELLQMHGITYEVTSPNLPRGNTLRIVPRGLADNSEIVQPIDGTVDGAEIADLSIDQAPEVYVYVRLPGDDRRLSLVAYASNRNKSLSTIFLPPLDDVPGAAVGHAGHDAMAVVESVFAWRFPIPGGRNRQLQYRLTQGEASWVLKFDRMDEF